MKKYSGFTFIELLVVMSIIATLLTLALPNYFNSINKAEEATLRQNLFVIREAIDLHYGDTGSYPASISELVSRQYLKKPPIDPITKSTDEWVVISPENNNETGVYDIHSSSDKRARNGQYYNEW